MTAPSITTPSITTPKTTGRRVSVLVAAHDCAPTLDRAIGSALACAETAEVIIVDDASHDSTRALAAAWEKRDGRVRLIALDANVGPAGARNRAIEAATGERLAVLDADDFFAPGRLRHLLAEAECDIVADNLAFVTEAGAGRLDFARLPGAGSGFRTVDAADFARGNLGDARHRRGEMGFLKPVMSRAFLDRHALRYDETLRLGEDCDLYMRMLLAGARFRLTARPGYGSVIRGASLSARHRTADLAALDAALTGHLAMAGPDPATLAAMRAHRREIRARLDHRRFLDRKAEAGPAAALRYALAERGRVVPILRGLARDKLRFGRGAEVPLTAGDFRLLMPVAD